MNWAHVKSHRLHRVVTPYVQIDPEHTSCENKNGRNNAEMKQKVIYLVFLQMLASQSWWSRLNSVTGTNVQMGAGLMKRNSYGKRMGHRRVRKIDFAVNLIYQLFWRCPISRGHIKPSHKQASTSCISRSTPSNHCALRGNNRIDISGYLTVSEK